MIETATAARLQGIGEYYFSKKLRQIEEMNKAGRQVINLGIGSPDQPPHPSVIETLYQTALQPNVHGYQSYRGAAALREAFAAWYQRSYGVSLDAATEILPLIGSKEGIVHICMTYLDAGDKALVPDPGYPAYKTAVELTGAEPLFYTLSEADHWHPNIDKLNELDLEGVKLMWLNYPHMPTGAAPRVDRLEALVQWAAEKNILLCHDNPYSFILSEKPFSLLSIPGAKEVAIELNSLSKSHNLAGWRVGMLAATAQRVDEVLRFKSNMDSGMFLPVQLAAAKALSLSSSWYEEQNELYSARKRVALKLLDLLQCDAAEDQQGMFLWARVPNAYSNGYALSDLVLEQAAVFITPGGIFGPAGEAYIRVSLCSPEAQFEQAIARVQEHHQPKNLQA